MAGTTAVVVGGGRGIGASTARHLANRGASVAVLANDCREVESVATEIRAIGGRSIGLQCDVTRPHEVEGAMALASAEFGPATVLVNSAGVVALRPIEETTVDTWEHLIAVNLTGTFLTCRDFVRRLPDELDDAVIVNVSSNWGRRGGPSRSAYCASKFGVLGLSEALAAELRERHVRVVAFCPGPTKTRMTREATTESQDWQGWMEPNGVGKAIANIASPDGRGHTSGVVDFFGFGRSIGL